MKRYRLVWLLLATVVLFSSLWLFLGEKTRNRGRVYKGKTVEEWVKFCVEQPHSNGFLTEAEPGMEEIREFGPEAVPYLIKEIKRSPGLTTTKTYSFIYTNTPRRLAKMLPSPVDSITYPFRAYCALGHLGVQARSAVPFLASQFNPQNQCVDFVRATLQNIGPAATEAVPTLTNALHSSDQFFRWAAARTLAKVAPEYPELIPMALAGMKSTNTPDRTWACMVLSERMPFTSETTAALRKATNDPDSSVRSIAEKALKRSASDSSR